jgi:hypothetical protein
MKKIQIKDRWNNKVLFEFESKDNTIKKTLLMALDEGADLQDADLRGAYLQDAYLQGADLQDAYLQGAYLQGAYLQGADLRGADLQGADLRGADLRGAYLQGADLQDAYLQDAYLQDAYLQGAYLRGAYLQGADLLYKIIPEIGQFTAWKRAKNKIIKIQIPSKAKRTSCLINRKCRAEFVKVLRIENVDGTKSEEKKVTGDHDDKTIYEVGKITKADSFDPDIRIDCTHGIHFFLTRQEAVNW